MGIQDCYLNYRERHCFARQRRRQGAAIAELLVAAILLMATVGVVATATVGTNKLLHANRDFILASDELANQMDQLLMLRDQQLSQALQQLQASELVTSQLVSVQLKGQLIEDESGKRLHLSINWKRMGPAQPLTLVSWLDESRNTRQTTEVP